jgi:hypothetical protein
MYALPRLFELRINNRLDDDELLKDVRVYGLAEYFIIEGLKAVCHRHLYSDPDCTTP